uniref:Uncharacterized protein n=1 Tax=Oryza sativa subsp. japonica TaxID=39947 RepID=Q7EYJ9_ORYSJ|nr:hypothetical protein [Oryza sativa Japonica Group]BAD03823.1 hypothetical protein [Oryza sativa Japonica Group]
MPLLRQMCEGKEGPRAFVVARRHAVASACARRIRRPHASHPPDLQGEGGELKGEGGRGRRALSPGTAAVAAVRRGEAGRREGVGELRSGDEDYFCVRGE